MTKIELKNGLIQRIFLYEKILCDLYGPQKTIRKDIIPKSFLYSNPLYFHEFKTIQQKKFIYIYTPTIQQDSNTYFIQKDNLSSINFSLFKQNSVKKRNRFLQKIAKTKDRQSVFFTGSQCFFYDNKTNTCSNISDFYIEKESFVIKKDNIIIPINLIFRNLDDNLCDSIEFNSCVGIPGLFQLIKLKKVELINAIGTQILETPFIQKKLNELCLFFLNEDLHLSSTYSYFWGKEKKDYNYIIDHFNELLFTSIYTNDEVSISIDDFQENPESYIAKKSNHHLGNCSQHCILACRDQTYTFK